MNSILSYIVLVIAAANFDRSECFPSGAPSAACSTLSPDPFIHGAQPQTSAVPYEVDLSAFDDGTGSLSYVPGETVQISLSSPTSLEFRGLLIQGRSAADDVTPMGSFTVTDSNTQLSSCSPPESALTHTSSVDKTGVSAMWTAPAAGSGPIVFGFAVVMVQVTYWANQRTVIIPERVSVVDCGPLPNPANGVVVLEGTEEGSTASYSCNTGFALAGAETRVCGGDGQWSDTAPTCEDIDECTDVNPCDANAACQNTPGSFVCTCNDGFAGDGLTCADIDECTDANPCDANAACQNTPGSFVCICNDGFAGDGLTCADIDECTDASPCDANAACQNTPGSFVCICNDGFAGDGLTCADIDECTDANPCDANAVCQNTPGSFVCTCNTGFAGDGLICADIDECTDANPCDTNAACQNTLGSFVCTCNDGFIGDGLVCADIDECSDANPCDVNAACQNTPGSFVCTCNTGFAGDGLTCADIDECTDANPCDANAACQNTPGSFICTCNDGFAGDGLTCADIDECTDANPCDVNAACENTPGSFICTCNAGFTGDGITCVGFCISNPCDINAVCEDIPGSFTCTCSGGFTGDGFTCADVNECNANPCDTNAACQNTLGSFVCTCNAGFTGDGFTCVVVVDQQLVNDTVIGDPLFTVPISVSSEQLQALNLPSLSLCYEIHGQSGLWFNLVTDECASVNAQYFGLSPNLNIIDEIGVRAVDDNSQCVNIRVNVNGCTAEVNGVAIDLMQRYMANGISVRRYGNRVRISVPNCDELTLVMWAVCEMRALRNPDVPGTEISANMIKFVVMRGLNFGHREAHGLLGQFWNIPVSVTPFTGQLMDGTPAMNHFIINLTTFDPPRAFTGWLFGFTWELEETPCLYVGDRQGGPIYEITDPNNGVIESMYTDYQVGSAFSEEGYDFGLFNEERCSASISIN